MEFTGKIETISKDIVSGKMRITFLANEEMNVINGYEELKQVDKLSIQAKKFRNKRSLDANAYSWVLISKMAEKLKSSKDEVYEEMLKRYGQTAIDENGNAIIVSLRASIDTSKLGLHMATVNRGYIKDIEYVNYRLILGQSEYDTKQMSDFIDGIVTDAQELGIDTISPTELKEMKERWGV